MKSKLLSILFISGVFSSCIKQAIEDSQQQRVIDAVTKGAWFMSSFKKDSLDYTPAFAGYLFYFQEDGTVRAVKDSVSTNGTWIGDIGARTITSEFPAAIQPILLLNGTWKVEDSYTNYIVATMVTPTGKNQLALRQQ